MTSGRSEVLVAGELADDFLEALVFEFVFRARFSVSHTTKL